MNAIVTNPVVDGVTLKIKDGHSFWEIDYSLRPEIYLYNPQQTTLSPQGCVDDFIQALPFAYEFTGTLFHEKDGLLHELNIQSEEDLSTWDILEYIYRTPVEWPITFVMLDYDKDHIYNGLQISHACDSYAETFEFMSRSEDGVWDDFYFVYPDRPVTIDRWDKIPPFLYTQHLGKRLQIPLNIIRESGKIYLYVH